MMAPAFYWGPNTLRRMTVPNGGRAPGDARDGMWSLDSAAQVRLQTATNSVRRVSSIRVVLVRREQGRASRLGRWAVITLAHD